MQLDVVIPTYNRSTLLPKTLGSLLNARMPPGLDVRIIAVDNNSTDDTKAVITDFAKRRTAAYLISLKNARDVRLLSTRASPSPPEISSASSTTTRRSMRHGMRQFSRRSRNTMLISSAARTSRASRRRSEVAAEKSYGRSWYC